MEKNSALKSNYYIVIQNGNVFSGTTAEFCNKIYTLPEEYTEEDKIEFIQNWAWDQNFCCDINYIN